MTVRISFSALPMIPSTSGLKETHAAPCRKFVAFWLDRRPTQTLVPLVGRYCRGSRQPALDKLWPCNIETKIPKRSIRLRRGRKSGTEAPAGIRLIVKFTEATSHDALRSNMGRARRFKCTSKGRQWERGWRYLCCNPKKYLRTRG